MFNKRRCRRWLVSNMEVRVLHFGVCSVISGLGSLKKVNRMWKKDVFFSKLLRKTQRLRTGCWGTVGCFNRIRVMREGLNQTGMLSFCQSDGYYLSFINK